MIVTLLCPRLQCRAILRVPDTVRGKQVRCGECGMAFIVPKTGNSAEKPRRKPEKQGTR